MHMIKVFDEVCLYAGDLLAGLEGLDVGSAPAPQQAAAHGVPGLDDLMGGAQAQQASARHAGPGCNASVAESSDAIGLCPCFDSFGGPLTLF
jgi:hypothetical protein